MYLYIKDKNGFITKQELSELMGGIELTKEIWENFIKDADINNDEKV